MSSDLDADLPPEVRAAMHDELVRVENLAALRALSPKPVQRALAKLRAVGELTDDDHAYCTGLVARGLLDVVERLTLVELLDTRLHVAAREARWPCAKVLHRTIAVVRAWSDAHARATQAPEGATP